jgi:hypothetical protein
VRNAPPSIPPQGGKSVLSESTLFVFERSGLLS